MAGQSTSLAQKDFYPTHPEVESMVRRSLEFLDNTTLPQGSDSYTLGALTIVESSKRYDAIVPVDHPVVVEAVKKILADLESGQLQRTDAAYYPALAIILLCDVGDEKYKQQINTLLKALIDRQEASGAFTYVSRQGTNAGDTSQTQYVALAIWVAWQHGFQIPLETPQKALQWLLDANLPDGGWHYEYINGSQSAHPRRPATLSIQAASLGTVYLLADFLQLNPRAARGKVNTDKRIAEQVALGTALPPSVSIYVPPKEGGPVIKQTDGPLVKFDMGRLNSVKRSGNDYLDKNFSIHLDRWGYYYLYALERYAFFREKAEGSVKEIPDWYDQGVRSLKGKQLEDGSFQRGQTGERNVFETTCFAVLFLVRSSEILILPGGEGNLSGSIGLKPNVRLDLVDGKVKSFDVIRGLDDVLQLLDSDDIDEEQFELVQDSLTRAIGQLADDPNTSRRQQLSRLRSLVSDRNYFRRLIAIKLLSRQQNMDNVPALIYALGDPDLRICAEAHNGLRLISRKLDSIQVSDDPDYIEYQRVKREWTDWFLKIRPGAELLD